MPTSFDEVDCGEQLSEYVSTVISTHYSTTTACTGGFLSHDRQQSQVRPPSTTDHIVDNQPDGHGAILSGCPASAGYELLQSPPDRFLCPRCQQLLRNAVQTECGHLFCAPCVQGTEEETKHLTTPLSCPLDGEEICSEKTFADRCVRREVGNLKVRCIVGGRGSGNASCDWTGSLLQWQEHYKASCPDVMERCECGEMVARRHQAVHEQSECGLRKVLCQHCQKQEQAKNLNNHFLICPEFQVKCHHGCGQVFKRKEIPEHERCHCPKVTVMCIGREVGCLYKGERDVVEEHFNNEFLHHLKLVTKHAEEQTYLSKALQSQLQELHATVNGLTNKIAEQEDAKRVLEMEVRQLKNENVDLRLQMTEQKRQTTQLKHDVEELKINTCSRRKTPVVLTRGIQDEDFPTSDLPENTAEGKEVSSRTREELTQLQRTSQRMELVIEDLQLRQSLFECSAVDGVLVWKISSIQKHIQEAISGKRPSLYSPPFFTSRFGYRMCARIYLHGDGVGRGTHVSLFFVVMRSEYDCLLQWPFRPRVSLSILDQSCRNASTTARHLRETFCPDAQSSSFQRPVSEMNIASGCPRFAPLSILEDKRYVKDDTIYIRVSVETANINSPERITG